MIRKQYQKDNSTKKLVLITIIGLLIWGAVYVVSEKIPVRDTNFLPRFQKAYAAELNVISVELTQKCLTVAKHNGTSKCPSYKDIVVVDTTEKQQKYVGKFVDKPYFHRSKGLLKNPSIMYRNAVDTVICVDCPADIRMRSKVIEITDNPMQYHKPDERRITNATRYEYVGRDVIGCTFATISWHYGMALLNDTINYFKSNCTDTSFIEKQTIYMNKTKPTYDGRQYQQDKWFKDAIKKAQELAREKCKKSQKC